VSRWQAAASALKLGERGPRLPLPVRQRLQPLSQSGNLVGDDRLQTAHPWIWPAGQRAHGAFYLAQEVAELLAALFEQA